MLSKKAIHRFAVCSSLILHGLGAVLIVLLVLLSREEDKPNLTVIEIAGVMGEPLPDMPPPDDIEEPEEADEPESVEESEEPKEIEEVGHENSVSEHQVRNAEEIQRLKEAEEKKKRLEAEKKRKEIEEKKKRLEAEKKRKLAEEKKKRLEAEKKRREADKRKAAERRKDRQKDLRNRLNQGKVLDSNQRTSSPRRNNSNTGPGLAERIAEANRAGTGGKGTSGTGTGRVTTGDYRSLLHDYCQRFWEEERPSRAQLGGKAPIIDIQVTVGSNGRIQRASIQKASGISAADQCAEQVLRKIRRVSLPPFSEYKISKSSLTFTIRLEVL